MNYMSKQKYLSASDQVIVLSVSMIDQLRKQHPQHDRKLALAGHCVFVASCCTGEDEPGNKEEKVEQTTLVEWLLDCVEQVPEPYWDNLRNAVLLMLELLAKQHPTDVGLFAHVIVLSNPEGYSVQKRINQEEELVDLLLLEGRPLLMEAIGLPKDCVNDHSGVFAPMIH